MPVRMPLPLLCLLASLAVAAPARSVVASVAPRLDACKLLSSDDVFRLIGWTVDSRERKPYAVMGATGTMCFLNSTQGEVTVTIPDRGSGYPGGGGVNDPGTAGLSKHVYGLGGEVILYNSTAYITRYHRSVSIRVVPNQGAASYNDVEGFARVALRHMQ